MGKATKRARVEPEIAGIDATPERLAQNDHGVVEALRLSSKERMAKVRRIKDPIDTLRASGKLDEERHANLAYYANQCHTARRSPTKDSLNQSRGGEGYELSAAIVSALLAECRIEREMGSLVDIARFVARDGNSLAAWCIHRNGGRERYDGNGKFIAMVPVREVECMKLALMELQMAADRISR